MSQIIAAEAIETILAVKTKLHIRTILTLHTPNEIRTLHALDRIISKLTILASGALAFINEFLSHSYTPMPSAASFSLITC